MKQNKVLFTETSYILGLIFLAVGTAFMEKADFGMSMVVAPAYLVYLKVSAIFPWFTFGMAEYCLQAVLLILTVIILRRFKVMFLFSFCTAVLYGITLDVCMMIVKNFPEDILGFRILFFVIGLLLGSIGVAMFFHTYIAPEAYELLVKEVSMQFNKKLSVVKTIYDCTSCAAAIIMSFLFFGFGHFDGVKLGTILCAVVNGWIIGRVSAFLDKTFEFKDGLKLRKYFE